MTEPKDSLNLMDAVRDQAIVETSGSKPEPKPLPDPRPRFGGSMISLVIWVSLAASIVALSYGVRSGLGQAFLASALCAGLAGGLWLLVFSRGRAIVTARKIAVRLPVLRSIEVQRLGALAGVASTTCARCESFDLAGGQHAIASHGDFRLAAAILRPSQMQKTKRGGWDKGNGFDERGQPIDDGGPDWKELGVCRKKGVMVFAPHSCEEWS